MCRYFGYPRFCSVYYFNMTCMVTIVTTLCMEGSFVPISQFYLSYHVVNTDHKKADWPLCLMKHLSMETYGEVAVWLHSRITSPPRQWSASHPFPLSSSEKKKSARFPQNRRPGVEALEKRKLSCHWRVRSFGSPPRNTVDCRKLKCMYLEWYPVA